MENRANAKKEADANNAMRLRHVITGFSYEKAFHKVYTDAKVVEVYNTVVEHLVQDRVWFYDKELKMEIPMDRNRVYTVIFNSETNDALCECKLFKCHGIMCRHQFKVFDDNGVKKVPSKYILRLWRKDVHRRHTRVKVAYHDPSKTEEVKRYDRIMVQFESVCLKAASRPEFVKMVFDAICKLEKSLDASILKDSANSGAAIQKGTSNTVGGIEKESANSTAAAMESSPSGLEDISINTPTPMELVPSEDCLYSGSSVNENLSEKCASKASFARTKTNNVGNCWLTEPELNNPPKPKRKRGRKAKEQQVPATVMPGHIQVEHGTVPTMWLGGIGYGPAYGEVGHFTRSIHSCPEWVARMFCRLFVEAL
uniref:Protein FAR1-RELATED SEQUENCE n=1 Tax=Chenopodium quinoa TaxID=63459 RepID=A0A803N1Z8_CHEQI